MPSQGKSGRLVQPSSSFSWIVYRALCLLGNESSSKTEVSSQLSGGKDTPQMFRGSCSSIPQCSGFLGSIWTTRAPARLSVK